MTVLAEAFVRSRDGRSILDRDEHGAEPVKAFTADPDRLRTAVALLEERGFTVEGIDQSGVAFSGPAEAFPAAFGVGLDYRDPSGADPGHPRWLFAGPAGVTMFTVASDVQLGGVVHTVLLTQQSVPVRGFGETEVFAGGAGDLLPLDLLLGEIGPALRPELPDEIRTRAAFPAKDRDTALTASQKALRDWARDDLYLALHDHIDVVRRGAPTEDLLVQLRLVEQAVPGEIMKVWHELCPDVAPPALTPHGTAPEIRDVPPEVPAALRLRIEHFRGAVTPAWRLADATAMRFRALVGSRGSPGGDAALTSGWPTTRDRLRALLVAIAAHRPHLPTGRFDLFRSDRSAELAAVLDKLDAQLQAGSGDVDLDKVAKRWTKVVTLLQLVKAWSDAEDGVWEEQKVKELAERHRHATMVCFASMAVAADAVAWSVVQAARPPRAFWSHRTDPGKRTVLSCSSSRYVDAGIDAHIGRERSRAAARLGDADTLRVVAAGNRKLTGVPPDAPCLDAVFAAYHENVLVVGGCGPDPTGGWTATQATHGYTIAVPAVPDRAGSDTARIPHVCVTTRAEHGGAVAFPDAEPQRRWWTGSGSSLSTPIAAAVCALVWSAFPYLSAAQVTKAVRDGAAELAGGVFHLPVLNEDKIAKDTNAVPPQEKRRVALHGALTAAMGMTTPVLNTELTRLLGHVPAAGRGQP